MWIFQVHVPALNHIGLWVDDLPVAVDYLTEQGVREDEQGKSYLHLASKKSQHYSCPLPILYYMHQVRFAPGGIRKGASGHDITFLHPKGNEAFPYSGKKKLT